MRQHDGFTLLEAIVILAVLFIVAAIAAPGVVSWSDDVRLRAAADRFGNDLHKAKERAVNVSKTVIVTLTPSQYHIFVDRGNGFGGPPNGTYDDDEPVVCKRQLPGSIQLKFGDPGLGTAVPPAVDNEMPVTYDVPEVDMDTLEGYPPPGELSGRWFGLTDEIEPIATDDADASQGAIATQELVPSEGDDDHQEVDTGLAVGLLAPANHRDRISFDNIGRCLEPQTIVLENTRGQKRRVAINALGNVKVTKIE